MPHSKGSATDSNPGAVTRASVSPERNPGITGPKAPVSVLIPARNEAANLRRCLAALDWADEVFVVDSQSTDDTARVASEQGAQVVQFYFNGSYPKKKNWALDNLPFRNDWVLIVDADEVVVPELAEEIARRTSADEADGFYLNMKYYFLGRRIRHCGYAEAWNLRLFKHGLGRYEAMPTSPGGSTGDNEAHEHVELAGRALRLVHELDHFAYPTISVWVEKHNRYASWEAEQYERFLREPVSAAIGPGKRFKRRLKKLYLRLPLRPLWRFMYAYVFRLGFLDGAPGLIFCTLLAFYDFLSWANVYERRLAAQGPTINPSTTLDRPLRSIQASDHAAPRPTSRRSMSLLAAKRKTVRSSLTGLPQSQPAEPAR
jgi:glycosyltransferase involved in cell wall biosynthesis